MNQGLSVLHISCWSYEEDRLNEGGKLPVHERDRGRDRNLEGCQQLVDESGPVLVHLTEVTRLRNWFLQFLAGASMVRALRTLPALTEKWRGCCQWPDAAL